MQAYRELSRVAVEIATKSSLQLTSRKVSGSHVLPPTAVGFNK